MVNNTLIDNKDILIEEIKECGNDATKIIEIMDNINYYYYIKLK